MHMINGKKNYSADEEEILINDNEEDVESELFKTFKFETRKGMRSSNNGKYILISLTIAMLVGICYILIFRSTDVDNFNPAIPDKKLIGIYENVIDALREPKYTSKTEHVDCGRILKGDKKYTQLFTDNNRIPLIKNRRLNMTCSAIQQRIHSKNKTFNTLKTGGVAFARIVYKDYEFIEKQVEMSWHPQNIFCFTIDKKSPKMFHSRMNILGNCVENIIVLPATENYDSNGHNMNLGHKRCMEALLQFPKWSYLIHLQNDDVVTKSVYEMARIFELLAGANDVNIGKEIDERRVPGLKWDPNSMKLFKKKSLLKANILEKQMKVVSGSVQSSWSRAAVKWLIEDVDLTIAINQFNQTFYAGDEQLYPSLQVNKEYGMPGHYTYECIDKEFGYEQITRISNWANGDINNCASKTVRNGVCIVGIEEFGAISRIPAIIINKMIPSFDYTVLECTAELLFNRTFLGQVDHKLVDSYYEDLPAVQYHKHHEDPGYKLNCTSRHSIWRYRDYI